MVFRIRRTFSSGTVGKRRRISETTDLIHSELSRFFSPCFSRSGKFSGFSSWEMISQVAWAMD